MTYELAKKLKDAGFPQHYPWSCGCDGPVSCMSHLVIREPYIPTLSELIEACGPMFRKLILHSENPKHPGLIWQAGANQYKARGVVSTRGKTPEEAVANLWIKLNEK